MSTSASASKKRKGKVIEKFDSNKFVSENAQKWYFDSMLKRNPIAKRGLRVMSIHWYEITENFRNRGWDSFCAQPLAAIDSVMREFYANALEHVKIGRYIC